MKIVIFYEKGNGVKDTLHNSIYTMLTDLNMSVTSIDYAYSLMNFPHSFSWFNQLKHKVKLKLSGKKYKIRTIDRLIKEIKDCDLIIFVTVPPEVFLPKSLNLIELIRSKTSIPILSYSCECYGNNGMWPYWIIKNYPESKGFDLFDHYLYASSALSYPIPNTTNPFSRIGFSLKNTTLKPLEKKEFIALIDFPREGHENLRQLQLEVLQKNNIKTIVLEKKISKEEIYQLYNRCSIFFLAFPESFGVPIIEFQTAGGLIFIPNTGYAPAHWLDKSGKLGSNFVIFSEDKLHLEELILKHKNDFDSNQNFKRFIKEYPELYFGDIDKLKEALDDVKKGLITSMSHTKYSDLKTIYAQNLIDYIENHKKDWEKYLNVSNKDIESGKKLA